MSRAIAKKTADSGDIGALRKFSPHLMNKIADLETFSNRYNWSNSIPDKAGRYQFCNGNEQQRSDPNWKFFEYEINEIGFRGPIPSPDEKNITLWLGCSFTFGEGLDYDQCFYGMVTEEAGLKSLNLGMMGFGYYQIANTMHAALNIWHNIERVIITWPNIHRTPYFTSENKMWNIHPHMDHSYSKEFVRVHDAFWKHWSNDDCLHKFRDAVEKTELLANYNNIKIIHGTWGGAAADEIINLVTQEPVISFGYRTSPMDYARDGLHPGIKQNRDYANKLLGVIKN